MITNLRYWCQKVLPLVYDDSLSYYELLNKVATKVNEMINQVNELPEMVDAAVKEQLDDGTVEAIVAEILTKDFFLNVKRPPEGVTAAKGDGATNDTTAFNEALAYAAEHDLAILIPEGDYVITSVLYNRLSSAGDPVNISILGCGSEASRLISAGNGNIFKISGGNYIRAFEMKGVGFSGGGASTAPALALVDITAAKVNLCDVSAQDAPTCFHISSCTNLNMEDIECRNYKGRGIWLQSCNHGTVTNVRMDGSITAGYNPVYLQACHDIQINDMMIDNTTGSEDICCTGTNSTCYGISARWSTALTEAPYYVDPNTNNGNEWHILFKSGPWTADMQTMQQEIDALPTDEDIQALQDQIDALPTDQDVADAVAGEAALREAADQGLQDQIDALPTTTNVSEAIAAAQEAYIMERDFNVRDFGAVGDGVTDDTQAFKDCITYMSSVRSNSNKVMFWAVVPPGKYKITDRIDIPQNMGIRGTWAQRLHGGQEGSWIYVCDDHQPTSYIEDRRIQPAEGDIDIDYATFTLDNGSCISDIGFYYPEQTEYNETYNQVKSYRYTIGVLHSRSNNRISNITAVNPYRFIYLGWAHDKTRISHIFGYPLSIGIHDIRSDDVDIIDDVHFHTFWSMNAVCTNYATVNLKAFILRGCDWTQMHNCFAYRCLTGITLLTATESNSYQGVRHLTADTMYFEVCTNACVFEGDDSSNYAAYDASNGHRDIRFTNCVFHGNGEASYGNLGYGLYLGYGREYNFTDCTFRTGNVNAYLYSGQTDTLLKGIKFIGCSFMNNGAENTSAHYGNIMNGAMDLIVIGCNFNSGSSNTYNNAILILPTAYSATITNNIFRNYAGNCLRSPNTNSNFTTAYFINNLFDSCTASLFAPSVTIGSMQRGTGEDVWILSNTAGQRFNVQPTTPTHKTGYVELYVDSSGKLCYTTSDGTKRTISYT